MKKLIAIFVGLISCLALVSATWIVTLPEPIKQIEEPKFAEMGDKMYIGDLSGNFVANFQAFGGWYYDSGWQLEDFQHPTTNIELSACTTGTETFVMNYNPSGSEASGRAWKFDGMSLLNQEGGLNSINNKVTAWTVNAVPPGGDYTHVFYEEFTGNLGTGIISSSLTVDGDATGNIANPTIIQTQVNSGSDMFQQVGVKIN